MKSVLITGATGNLGGYLLKEFLESAEYDRVYALARNSINEMAEDRINKVLNFWDVPAASRVKLQVLVGDVNKLDLGMQGRSRDIDLNAVIHAASNIRHDLTREEACTLNVNGTLNVLNYFERSQKFVHVSTLEVVGLNTEVIKEEILSGDTEYLSSYAYSKAKTENELCKLIQQGKNINVIRPSMIIGHSKSGKIPQFQSFYLLFDKLILDPPTPVVPWGPPIDIVPVDVIGRGIRYICNENTEPGDVYHFCPGLVDETRFMNFVSWLKRRDFIKLPWVKYMNPRAYELILTFLINLRLGPVGKLKIQKHFLQYAKTNPKMDNRRTVQLFRSQNDIYPDISSYIKPVINYYLSRKSNNRLPF